MFSRIQTSAGRTCALAAVLLIAGAACTGGASPPASATLPSATGTPSETTAASPAPSAAPSGGISTNEIQIALDLANKAIAGQAAEYRGTSGKTIGFVAAQLSNDGFRAQYIGFLAGAIQASMNVVTLNAENDATKQLNMIQDLLTRKVDAIVFTPVDSAALSAGVIAANKANVPVILIDRSTEGGQVTALVESDNVAIGAAGADLLWQAASQANIPATNLKVFELMGDQATSAGVERHEGFSKQAQKLGLNIVVAIDGKWDAAKGNAAVLDAFQRAPDINAVYMASGCAYFPGVFSALKSLNKLHKIGDPGHIIWISTDGCPGPVDAVREGYVDGDAAQRIIEMGLRAAEAAVAAINKQPVEPRLLLGPDPITPANVNDPTHWSNVLKLGS